MNQIILHIVACRACNKEFKSLSVNEATRLHKEHIAVCPIIKGLEKIERFREACEEILERKVSWDEAANLLGVKKTRKG